MNNSIICFGEVMARFTAPAALRLRQALPGKLDVTFAGAEANSGAMIVSLGGNAQMVTALPGNDLAEACLANMRAFGLGLDGVVRTDEGRMGLFFLEEGANQRSGSVLYDREHSAFSITQGPAYRWPQLFSSAKWLHTTGISCGVSQVAAEATLHAVQAAKSAGLRVSFDINFRRKLWRWDPKVPVGDLMRRTLARILPHVDVLIGNPFDIGEALGLDVDELSTSRDWDTAAIQTLAARAAERFPGLDYVAISLRRTHSAARNDWGACLYQCRDRRGVFAPLRDGRFQAYEIHSIVDRLGTGDAFAGALVYAFCSDKWAEMDRALSFATAASCLAHSIRGDFKLIAAAEVAEFLAAGSGGWISR